MKKEKNYQKTYDNYLKPKLSPPSYIFGIVWPILYILIIFSYAMTIKRFLNDEFDWIILIPFLVNIIANISYTYFQFRLKNYFLALVDILVVLITIIMTMILIWPYSHLIAYMQIPYLAWVSFATYLQIGVIILNRKI